MNEIEFGELI